MTDMRRHKVKSINIFGRKKGNLSIRRERKKKTKKERKKIGRKK